MARSRRLARRTRPASSRNRWRGAGPNGGKGGGFGAQSGEGASGGDGGGVTVLGTGSIATSTTDSPAIPAQSIGGGGGNGGNESDGQVQDYRALLEGHRRVYAMDIRDAVRYDEASWLEEGDRLAVCMWISVGQGAQSSRELL